MHRLLVLSSILTAALAVSARAERPIAEPLQEGTPVVLVGQITDSPGGLFDPNKMQVAVGETRRHYSLHIRGASVRGPEGQRWHKSDLDEGRWVRAEGRVMNDPRRVRVDRVRVITAHEAHTIQ